MQPLYEFGGQGPVVQLAVANGFPPQTYQPLLGPLTGRYRVVCLPPRPLWTAPPPPASITSWRSLGDDLLAGMTRHHLHDVIGVGHSFGAVALLLAAANAPGRFRALILLDPPLLSPWFLRGVRVMQALGLGGRLPLAQGALRRRHRFSSVDEALAYWRTRPLFHDWPDATLRLYAESMTRPAADGNGLELAWSREWEAQYYRTLYTGIWRLLRELPPGLPLLVMRGTTTYAFPAASMQRLRRLRPGVTLVEIEGGHLFPHTAPDTNREVMARWLEETVPPERT